MEIKNFIKLVKNNLIFIVFFMVLGGTLAYTVSYKQPTGQRASQILYLQASNQNISGSPETGFEKQERARNFTDTAIVITQNGNLDIPLELNPSYTTKKLAPQIIRLDVYAISQREAEKALQKVSETARQKISDLTSNELELIIATDAKVLGFCPSHKIYIAAGIILGAAAALFVVSLKEYFNG